MKKVLIIEDDSDSLQILGMIVENCNYDAVLSSKLLSLIEVEKLNPDLILLDQWVLNETGSYLCREVKQNPKTQDITVIMISAVPNIGEIADENGANGCLEKPYNVEDVELVLQAYLF